MKYPADSTAKLCQGGKGRYVSREGVPVDICSGEKCEPVIVFESIGIVVAQGSVVAQWLGTCLWCLERFPGSQD